jgi:predicted Ser/Thr protein kinase
LLQIGLGTQPESASATEPTSPRPAPPSPGDLAKHFPQLEIIELIGQGGMGIVYKARQPRLDRLVALKILPVDVPRDGAFAERFAREARALARLSHPSIVAVYDFGEVDGMYYLLMEYVDGANLRQLERSGLLSPREALKIVPAICDALQYAHDQGIVHRDVKPENVLIDPQGRVKIADFGLAKILGRPTPDRGITQAQQVMGTPNYMAPEQIEHPLEVDHRADIYSLGVVLYEMLTGELPIGRFELPSHRVQVDVRFDQVVLRALEKERERRYQKASEVKTDVESIATTALPPTSATAPDPTVAQWLDARRTVRGPAIGLVITGVLNWVLIPVYIVIGVRFASASGGVPAPFAPFVIALLLVLAGSSFMIFAGLKMKALEAYGVAMAGSILAILISPGNLIGLPLGIWALVTLTRPDTKAAFQLRQRMDPGALRRWPAAPPAAPADGARRLFFNTATVVLIGGGVLVLLVLGLLVASVTLPAIMRAKQRAQAIATAQRAAQAELVRSFTVSDPTLTTNLVAAEEAWFLNCTNAQVIHLFEVANPGLEQCAVIYRARLKAENLQGRAYLEMWCRFPGRGEFFSRGLDHVLSGTSDWAWFETPFLLKAGERPDLIRLNLAIEGTGTIGIDNVELRRAPPR